MKYNSPMDEDTLVVIVDRYLSNSSSIKQSDSDNDNADAIRYFYGKEYGNEVDGRSRVVTREVMESIEWALPSIIRVFASGDRFVEFDPVGPEDVDQAEQETDYVNHIIIKKNNGWKMFYDWFKGAMIQKNAYVKTFVEEKKKYETTNHTGMTADQLLAIKELDGVEIIELEETPVDPGMEQLLGPVLYNVVVRREFVDKQIKAECVPQEEVKVHDDWGHLSLDGCPFVCHEREMSISDLVAMGYDEERILEEGSIGDDPELSSSSAQARDRYNNDSTDSIEEDSQKSVTVQECYILVDYDGDGVSELRRVFKTGKYVMANDEFDEQPFSTISPVPMPHQHIGMSWAELVMDIQKIKSTLIRQMLDNLYLTNNPEKEVVEGLVRMEDLLVSHPGGIKRVQMPNSIRELTVPFTAGQSIPMLEILDKMFSNRIGVSQGSMGLDADVLAKTTRGAFMGAMESASQRIEMVSRVFAETGVKELFKKIHKLAIQHMDKSEVIRIRGKYVPVHPNEWKDRFDTTVVVGLGSGNRDQQLSHLGVIAEKQEQHMIQGSPMVELDHLYHTYSKMLNIIGFKDSTRFFLDPASDQFKQKIQKMAQQPPKPSDTDKALMAQQQIEQLKAKVQQFKAGLENQREQMKMSFDAQKHMDEMEFKYKELSRQLEETMTKLELEYSTDVPGSVV